MIHYSVFYAGKYGEYQQLQSGVRRGDCLVLERHIDKHIDGMDPMASLTSRSSRHSHRIEHVDFV